MLKSFFFLKKGKKLKYVHVRIKWPVFFLCLTFPTAYPSPAPEQLAVLRCHGRPPPPCSAAPPPPAPYIVFFVLRHLGGGSRFGGGVRQQRHLLQQDRHLLQILLPVSFPPPIWLLRDINFEFFWCLMYDWLCVADCSIEDVDPI